MTKRQLLDQMDTLPPNIETMPPPAVKTFSTPVGSGPAQQPVNMAVRRFDLVDLADMGVWLVARLQEQFPHINQKMIAGWVRGLITSNEHLFLRSHDAVLLAQIARAPLSSHLHTEEVFLFVRNEAIEEGLALYHEMKTWSNRLGSKMMMIERQSDVPHDIIKKALENFGRMYRSDTYFFHLE